MPGKYNFEVMQKCSTESARLTPSPTWGRDPVVPLTDTSGTQDSHVSPFTPNPDSYISWGFTISLRYTNDKLSQTINIP